ncbi:hypothetical protein A7K91_11905 [Paenibacillus oryzae]|uniref:HTH merR-type domain-containing protein n=1 Tax=Paenibacillus oryzae TaxID=1844972 RepID=A0A1A5YF62_9BACL|nr:MerR family DNA-binding transcriptional regulator [Paenibacillus oryzae]OBR64229.1 hypothetical protein A7K91_11905 [Paenibacillus oryzae]
MNNEEKLSVGQLSQKTGLSIRTLHYYEEQGFAEASPFTPEEEEWLNAAIEHVMSKRIAEETR